MGKQINFNECPRPQFVRDSYQLLDGKWDFAFDYNNIGESKKYYKGFNKEYDIVVPFSYLCAASNVNIEKRCDNVWYQKIINIEKEKKNYFLHFEGADYLTTLYVNGKFVDKNEGGYHRFSFNITNFIKNGDNLIVVKCEDDFNMQKIRGKQRWQDKNHGCWYVETTGIYKSVWLEKTPLSFVKNVKITPSLNDKKVYLEYSLANAINMKLKSTIYFDNEIINSNISKINEDNLKVEIKLKKPYHLWDLDNPALYDLKIELINKRKIIDTVNSYFGLRELQVKDRFIYLNGKKLYQKLVLDQGYYLTSSLTPLTNKDLYNDIVKMKELGFNGCRKHEKQEDERFAYYADVLGYLIWSEIPSFYLNTLASRQAYEKQFMKIIKQNYNHPSIITWTLFNESWGIEGILNNKVLQEWVNYIYYITKEYDPYRFVITNDGWEHTISDIITIHHYEQDGDKLYSYFKDLNKVLAKPYDDSNKNLFADGYKYNNQPIMFTEFGGTAYEKNTSISTEGMKNWGYGVGVNDDIDYIKRLSKLFNALNRIDYSNGYCFTQLSDVQQEVNGLLYIDRTDKIDPKIIKEIQDRRN